jgi:hypothetical protein|tara:strand:+ start:1205 stop:1717 length:513 start_codon:yes stop_codon:yes gene_type:complete
MRIYPKNKEHFKKLIPFAKKIISICRENKIDPIIYGSFVHFVYTKDTNMNVNDIDIIIPRNGLKKLIKLLKKDKIKFIRCSPEDYSIIIKKGKLKLELDEVGTGYKTLNKKSLSKNIFNKVDFYGTEIRIITLKQLEEMYPIAYNRSKEDKVKLLKKIKHLEKFLGRKLK